ncbi:MAG: winged helix-turn-helix transcriptional regulator [Deltaproteobacteria bacterium]|nr:winged helix-turn-helix transcriptional regulator [Deltaproteobacteria bacterium]
MKIEPFEIFKVLSVDTRVKIIELLKAQGPLGAKDISAAIGITTAAVSQHLKILKERILDSILNRRESHGKLPAIIN